ncbi:hypothetical protein SanaruYs_13630 [Chryseotalea sanaruensis]|uniref:Uncharacterized protein n=1 Tax=Chryseotalea sanaruensis TaxID=2482724 RepID=A0A401U8C3_9BACT|nr:hypothetical protein [Chryseotalea sanaruensis]GCC51143.1 hypothetical protein SanaruYs_13630 [Chryseotalea sanaruensis]
MAKGEKISKLKARKWVNNYKKKHGKDKNFLSSMLFDKHIVLKMLHEDKCEGLRIYNALDDEGKIHFVLVGTDANGNNIMPPSEEYSARTIDESPDGESILINNGLPCPFACPDDDL